MLGSVWIYPRSHAKKNIQRDKYIAKWNTLYHLGVLINTDSNCGKSYLAKINYEALQGGANNQTRTDLPDIYKQVLDCTL